MASRENIKLLDRIVVNFIDFSLGNPGPDNASLYNVIAVLARILLEQERLLLLLGPCEGMGGEPGEHKWSDRGYGRTCVECGAEKG